MSVVKEPIVVNWGASTTHRKSRPQITSRTRVVIVVVELVIVEELFVVDVTI